MAAKARNTILPSTALTYPSLPFMHSSHSHALSMCVCVCARCVISTSLHRVLRRLTLEDAAAASHTFVTLMGDKVAPRRALIEAEGQKYTLEQLDI